jgi:pimeloyl-ACP methyl ester carboxylesterase
MNNQIVHPPGRHYVVGTRELWVEEEGRGVPVLLLGGFGPAGSHLIFHPTFTALSDRYRVIYCDLYGRGRSGRPSNLADITFHGDVVDIAGLIDVMKIGPVHIYGFSYGGLIAQQLALSHSRLVRTLTLANTLHSPEMWQLNHVNINRELANQYPEVWGRILNLRRQGVVSTDPRMQKEFAVAAPLVRFYNPDNAKRLLSEPGSRNLELYPIFCGADVDFIIGNQLFAVPDFRPRLKDIEAPLLVLAGRYDRALHPSLQQQFVDFAPRAQLQFLEHSGSFGHIEEPEVVFAALKALWSVDG